MSDEERTSDAEAGDAADEKTLEDRIGRLEEIVRALESEDLDLERSLALFEEGVGHIRAAEELLSTAELRVEELVGDGEDPETRRFDREDTEE